MPERLAIRFRGLGLRRTGRHAGRMAGSGRARNEPVWPCETPARGLWAGAGFSGAFSGRWCGAYAVGPRRCGDRAGASALMQACGAC